MRAELSIKATYLSDWGVLEGVRELIQNAKDAETDGYPMTITSPRKGILRIQNDGVSLSHKVLLFGHTTKEGREDQIGQFGEGLKLAVLTLVRAGRDVKIYSGDEIWTPVIDHSKVFDEKVLCFNIGKSSKHKDFVRIDIDLNKEEWEEQKKNFLFISPPQKSFNGYYGSVILDPELKGKIFVKGIFVQDEKDFEYGSNLIRIDVDRDRRMVRSFDLEYHVGEIWKEVSTINGVNGILYNLLKTGAKDTNSFQYYPGISEPLLDYFMDQWKEEHFDAFPVLNSDDAKSLSFLGATGIVISSKQLAEVLWRRTGRLENIKEALSASVIKTYDLSELSPMERQNYLKATNIVSSAIKIEGSKFRAIISIVDFNSQNTLGQFKQGKIFINRCCLQRCSSTIATLTHEAAHFNGDDGNKGHIDLIESIWENISKWFLKEK
jgi:hypothetical protein